MKAGKLIALDTTNNLIGKMTDSNVLRLKLDPDVVPPGLQALQISHVNGIAELRIENFEQVETIIAVLRTARIHIVEMQLQQPDLEDVFVHLLSNHRKDGA